MLANGVEAGDRLRVPRRGVQNIGNQLTAAET